MLSKKALQAAIKSLEEWDWSCALKIRWSYKHNNADYRGEDSTAYPTDGV